MNLYKVSNHVWRGSSPNSIADLEKLERLGIMHLLDLETGSHFFLDGSPLRESLQAEMLHMRSYAHPLGAILPPTKNELEMAFDFIINKPMVYIHCKAGVDRTGMVIAHYQTKIGHSRKYAIENMKQMGMHWWYYWWAWFL